VFLITGTGYGAAESCSDGWQRSQLRASASQEEQEESESSHLLDVAVLPETRVFLYIHACRSEPMRHTTTCNKIFST
jgi:hypothetical protein